MRFFALLSAHAILHLPFSSRAMPRRGGPCQAVVDEDGAICGHEGLSSTWYGKRGHQFCGSHRAAWMRWRASNDDAEEGEDPSYLTEMESLLGVRYCEPSMMKDAEKFNDVKKNALQFCVQGTFTPEGYQRGRIDTRWQTLDQLTERCSKEDFEALYKQYLKDIEKTFKRDAKRFKSAAQLEEEDD